MAAALKWQSIVKFGESFFIGIDTTGNMWILQVHPHSAVNPMNTSRDGWTVALLATPISVVTS